MKRLKITAYLKRPLLTNGDMYLDAIIYSYCAREQLGEDWYWNKLEMSQKLQNIKLPIQKVNGLYMCSRAKYKPKKEFVEYWRKRFQDGDQFEKYCNLGKKSKLYVNMGVYKNYNMPINCILTDKIEWIIIGDKEEIEKILKNIYTVGKKRSQGYGMVKEWKIEETKKRGERHFPVHNKNIKEKKFFCSLKPPYFLLKREMCIIRKF
ncbi:MAG: hypothetical protein ACOCWW_00175 [Bacteroidota bacterium]